MHKNTEMHKLFWTKSCASQMWLSFLFKKHCSCIVTDCFLIIFSPTIWFNSNLLIIIVFISLIYDKTKKPQHEHNTKPLLREDTEVQKERNEQLKTCTAAWAPSCCIKVASLLCKMCTLTHITWKTVRPTYVFPDWIIWHKPVLRLLTILSSIHLPSIHLHNVIRPSILSLSPHPHALLSPFVPGAFNTSSCDMLLQ